MRNYISWSLALISLIFCIYQCERRNQENRIYKSNLNIERDSVIFFKNSNNKLTTSIGVMHFDKTKLKNEVIKKDAELSAMAKEFANIKSVIKIQDRIVIDSIKVLYEVPVYDSFERLGKLKKKWYSFNYKSNEKGFEIDNLIIPNEINIATGTKRKWFLGAETLTTDVTSTNPYIKTKNIQSVELVVKVPWYKKWYVWIVTGIACGWLIAK